MGLMDTLNVGYSGLQTSQTGVTTTSHNIANKDKEGYTRQRIDSEVNTPLNRHDLNYGNGSHVEEIVRIHDEFVYKKLKSSGANLEYNQFSKDTLQEIANLSPELDGLGISQDIKEFFSSWSDFAQNPSDEGSKVVVADTMKSISSDLNSLRESYVSVQDRLDDELQVAVDEVNDIASEIANINKGIAFSEAGNGANANDLRDQRDSLELRLSKLIDSEVFKGEFKSDSNIDRNLTDQGTEYNINIAGGLNIVDGVSYHPLTLSKEKNDTRFNSLYFEDQSHRKIDITDKIHNGKIGAIVDLRGSGIDEKSGKVVNSKIQDYIDDLDDFSKALIQKTNSIYAQSPQDSITSDPFVDFSSTQKLINYDDNIKTGSFDLVVYNGAGEEVATKSINITDTTDLNDIVTQINSNSDDNSDNDGTNDIDDLFSATFGPERLHIMPKDADAGYTIAIKDNGTNLAGVMGVHKLFEGDNAKNIDLARDIKEDPSKLNAYSNPVDGDNSVANAIVAFEYEEFSFAKQNGVSATHTIESFYRTTSVRVASDAQQATAMFESAEVLNQTVEDQMASISGVDMDEELINLMKYQTAYQANAKVITAIDRMMDTLLGIKQ